MRAFNKGVGNLGCCPPTFSMWRSLMVFQCPTLPCDRSHWQPNCGLFNSKSRMWSNGQLHCGMRGWNVRRSLLHWIGTAEAISAFSALLSPMQAASASPKAASQKVRQMTRWPDDHTGRTDDAGCWTVGAWARMLLPMCAPCPLLAQYRAGLAGGLTEKKVAKALQKAGVGMAVSMLDRHLD